jgi:hypothetical protein
VAFVDDDCLLAPDWLEQTAAFARAHSACGAFGGRITLAWEGTPPAYARRFPYAFAGKNHGSCPHRRSWLAGLGMTLRRAALESTGWLEQPLLADRTAQALVSGGDVEIGLRIATRYEVWYAPECRITHFIPLRRTSRPYLARLLRGLGSSRHDVAALTWRGSYPAFALYELLGSAGLLVRGAADGARELLAGRDRAGFGVTLSPAKGWIQASIRTLRLDSGRRRALLGGALAPRGQANMG